MDIKIHNSARNRKRQNEKKCMIYNQLTPPKYTTKSSTYNTVARWQKKCGYNFDCPEDEVNPMLREMRQEFQDKAVKYCGGKEFSKKQTRFDKMRMKQETGFKLQELPIKKKLRKADLIITTLMKKQALYALARC